MSRRPQISIVIPILNEAESVGELSARIQQAMRQLGSEFEVIFVDDLSTDDTLARIQDVRSADERFKVVQFSRRFGYQTSIFAGLEYSHGDIVVTMDSDLQHPPELIPGMVAKSLEGNDIVNMVRQHAGRKSPVERAGSRFFYWLINSLSPTPIAFQSADFRLYTRQAVDALTEFPERSLFLRGLVGWLGFTQVDMTFEEESRRFGKSKFSIFELVRFAANAIVSFSNSPLYLAIYLGGSACVAGALYGVYIVVNALFSEGYPAGWPTLVCLVLLIGGIQMILLGIIGLYVGKVYVETKSRPRYIVGRTMGIETRE